jgi:hypothetical protein
MSCIECESDRIISINAKVSDLFVIKYNKKEHDGYVPHDIGLGGGDNLEFDLCLECGQVQDDFPVSEPEFADEDEDEDEEDNDDNDLEEEEED